MNLNIEKVRNEMFSSEFSESQVSNAKGKIDELLGICLSTSAVFLIDILMKEIEPGVAGN